MKRVKVDLRNNFPHVDFSFSVHLEIIQKCSWYAKWKTVKNASRKYIFIIAGLLVGSSKGYLGHFLHWSSSSIVHVLLYQKQLNISRTLNHISISLCTLTSETALADLFSVQVEKQREEQKVLTEWSYKIKDHIVSCYLRYFFFKVSPLLHTLK